MFSLRVNVGFWAGSLGFRRWLEGLSLGLSQEVEILNLKLETLEPCWPEFASFEGVRGTYI